MTELTIRPEEIRDALDGYVRSYNPGAASREEVGRVTDTGDGIAHVEGLPSAMTNELLEFEDGTLGLALNLDTREIGVVILGVIGRRGGGRRCGRRRLGLRGGRLRDRGGQQHTGEQGGEGEAGHRLVLSGGHSGATTTPQGCWPTWIDFNARPEATSITVTSFELPLVV